MKWVLFFFLTALPAFADSDVAQQPSTPRPVVSVIINAQSGLGTGFIGTVAARTETNLGFPLAGTLASRAVEAGQTVRAKDVLGQLDPEDLDADVRAAEAGVAVASAQLRTARDAETRRRALTSLGTDSTAKLEDAVRALTAAEARLDQAKATLARAQDVLELATLHAPFDGIVTQTFVHAGAAISAGQPILRLAGTEAREITIDVTEKDAASLTTGLIFDTTLAVDETVSAQATLTRIEPVADKSTRTRRAHLTLTDPPEAFRLGSLTRVTPQVAKHLTINLIQSAVRTPDGAAFVWVVDRSDNSVHKQPVTLGATYGSQVRITQGLTQGDEVIIKGVNSLKDGQFVGPRVSE
ncbi:MAG: efflux RND transporter periplasmic adaptor subunit [Sulfitobacter sp.]